MDVNSPEAQQIIKIRTAEGFVYSGKRLWYAVWFKHIFRDYEEIG